MSNNDMRETTKSIDITKELSAMVNSFAQAQAHRALLTFSTEATDVQVAEADQELARYAMLLSQEIYNQVSDKT